MKRLEMRLKRLARRYAESELGWARVDVYGYQADPGVRYAGAVWLRLSDGSRTEKLGVVVNDLDGVLEEFDPEIDGEPGELHSGAPRYLPSPAAPNTVELMQASLERLRHAINLGFANGEKASRLVSMMRREQAIKAAIASEIKLRESYNEDR